MECYPQTPQKPNTIKHSSSIYTLLDGHLFRFGFSRPILTCIDHAKSKRIMIELHKGIYGSHVGGYTLMLRVLRAGYFRPTMKKDYMEHV